MAYPEGLEPPTPWSVARGVGSVSAAIEGLRETLSPACTTACTSSQPARPTAALEMLADLIQDLSSADRKVLNRLLQLPSGPNPTGET